jgi:hypothetical protein
LITTVDRYLHAARFVLCERCGTVWNTPRVDAAGYAALYQTGAYRRLSTEFGENNGATEETRELTRQVYGGIVAQVFDPVVKSGEGLTLLDVGGSDGRLAEELRVRWKLGEVAVIEPAPDEAAAVPDGITVYQGTFDEIDLPKSYDVVTCFQTIEHFQDPRAALEKMRTLTRKYLLIDCINFPVMWKALRHKSCKIDHPWNFHYEALKCLLHQTGFKPIDTTFRKDKPTAFIAAVPAEPVDKLPGPAFVNEVMRMFA